MRHARNEVTGVIDPSKHAHRVAQGVPPCREAWRRLLDNTYSEKELFRHDLVLIEDEKAMFGTRTRDHQEIRWVAHVVVRFH